MVKSNPYDTYIKRLGKNLRQIRRSKGLTMEAVAHEAEIEYRQLGRIERGEINTSVISLKRISEVLKVEMEDLFKFENE